MSYRELKRKLCELLAEGDIEGVTDLVTGHPRGLGALISLTYDKTSLLAWQAVEAMGPVVGRITGEAPEAGRVVVQRLLWSITEESGGIGWSAVEMLGEVVRVSPGRYSDLLPIIIGLYEEEIFRTGVLHALCRMSGSVELPRAQVRELLARALEDRDPGVRGAGLVAIECLQDRTGIPAPERVRGLVSDTSRIMVYRRGRLAVETVGGLAAAVLAGSGEI